jgi:mannitol/fructose-specific phosphotransferase system IIA component (Ntr-type)
MDNRPVNLVLLTLFPATQNGRYVSFLAAALATLNDPALMSELVQCETPGAIHDVLMRTAG